VASFNVITALRPLHFLLHRESKKQRHQTLADFQNFFTSELGSKFATNSCLNIPPRFKHVATLPCEIIMSENGIILKYVLQGGIATNLRYDELLYYIFIIHSACERIFNIGQHLAKLQAKWLTVIHPIRLALLSSKRQILPDKLNNLCITDRNCC